MGQCAFKSTDMCLQAREREGRRGWSEGPKTKEIKEREKESERIRRKRGEARRALYLMPSCV